MTNAYTTVGLVRGSCGHRHRSIKAAAKCADRDHRSCQNVGGYSDRYVRRIEDGEVLPITEWEQEELDQIEAGE